MRLSFEQSAETRRIVEFLIAIPINVPTSHAELERAVGRHKPSSYQSAVRIARKKGVIIEAIRGFGFQRLTASETVSRQDKHLRSIRRKANIMQTEVEVAMRGNLPHAEQTRALHIHAAAGIIKSSTIIPQSNVERPLPPGAQRK